MIHIIPTDTCYGLACSLSDEIGYRSIYAIKGRNFSKPLAQVVETFDIIAKYASITDEQVLFLKQYPHPFTLLAVPKDGAFPSFIDPHRTEFALRVAEVCLDSSLRAKLPFPLFLTSANRSGEKECQSALECEKLLADSGVEYTMIGGGIIKNPPSDIFSFVGETTEIEYVRRNYG